MVMKKLTGLLTRGSASGQDDSPAPEGDSPEAVAGRSVRLFCESGGPSNAAEEIQYLPSIVETAESSPAAAATCAHQIRKFLSSSYASKAHVQYNAVMLIRILADNPGPTFTRNIDKKFADTVKDLLRNGRDPSVQQILRETLRSLYSDKAYDQNLSILFQMWQKEPAGMQQRGPVGAPVTGRVAGPGWEQYQPGLPQSPSRSRSHRGSRGLPPPAELAARIEEAKTSGKLLLQLIQSSVPEEILGNDLIKEFAERCQAAQRSIQGYIACDSPPPDEATMQTLVDTSEQLSLAISRHQRAIMAARKVTGPSPVGGMYNSSGTPSGVSTMVPASSPEPSTTVSSFSRTYSPPPGPPPAARQAAAPLSSGAPIPAPPTALQTNLERRNSPPHGQYQGEDRVLHGRSNGTHEDPFSDDYHEDDANVVSPYQTYQPPMGPPPPRPGAQNHNDYQQLEQGVQRLGLDDRARDPSFTGQPGSYHPGYQSTPSYVQRQESAQNHVTMHGAAGPRASVPSSDGEVSPIAERSPRKVNGAFRY